MKGRPGRGPGPSEAIILAGGQGTRLKSVVSDVPKPMAPVGGMPFLAHLLEWLSAQGIARAVLSVGYQYELIESHFRDSFEGITLSYAVESRPMGTGGGVLFALEHVQGLNVLLLNGDTFFSIDVARLWDAHLAESADVTLSLRRTDDTGRYGLVEVDATGRITGFEPRGGAAAGFINGGVYALSVAAFRSRAPGSAFSLEKDFLETNVSSLNIRGVPFDGFFIDIGTPEDYALAQHRLPEAVRDSAH